ncbi:hypothetical protein BV898_11896 [Hypsibius exemplaris]|uniref:Uncharacterized protein n=1 Tax=Hypsibius exemplaris TaxID=2072580 RepID=A0A1W0WFD1_HYPEX|nr:hypothetical protein BV898_11896 [Hypsibius exemplaris]
MSQLQLSYVKILTICHLKWTLGQIPERQVQVYVKNKGIAETGSPSVGDVAPFGHTFSVKYGIAGRFEDSKLNDNIWYRADLINPKGPMCMQNPSNPPWTLTGNGRGLPGAGADLAKALNIIVVIPQFRTGVFENALALAASAGCPSSLPGAALLECLNKIPAKDLQILADKFVNASAKAPGAPVWSMYNKQDASIVALLAFGANVVAPGTPTLAFLKGFAIPLVIQQATLCKQLTSTTINLVAETYGMTATADALTLRKALFQEALLYSQSEASNTGSSVSVLAFDADISAHSPLANFVSGLGVYHTDDVGYLFAGTMTPLVAGLNDTSLTQAFRQQFNHLFTQGHGLGDPFDAMKQNYLELGQDRTWQKHSFQRTVQLIKFWDRLKELRCQVADLLDLALQMPPAAQSVI